MMDDFSLYPREEPFDPFSVMLFKALQIVAFLFFIALLAIAPDAKEGKVDSKAGSDRQHRLVSPSRVRLPHTRPRRSRRRQ